MTQPSDPKPTGSNRIIALDIARGFAIILALIANSIEIFGGWDTLVSGVATPLLVFTRSATPIFIILFGIMLELVYRRRIEAGGYPAVKHRLLSRSLQCYGGYLAIVAAVFVGGAASLSTSVRSLVFLAPISAGDILIFYTWALLLATPLLLLRQRLGLLPLTAGVIGLWLVPLVLNGASGTEPFPYISSLLFGLGDKFGPSVLHGLTFITIGLLLGRMLRRGVTWRFYLASGGIFAVSLLCVLFLLFTTPFRELVLNFANLEEYRYNNHIGYYAIGTTQAIAVITLFVYLFRHKISWRFTRSPIRLFGTYSLSAYTLGNILIYLADSAVEPLGYSPIILGLMILSIVYGLLFGFAFWQDARKADI